MDFPANLMSFRIFLLTSFCVGIYELLYNTLYKLLNLKLYQPNISQTKAAALRGAPRSGS